MKINLGNGGIAFLKKHIIEIALLVLASSVYFFRIGTQLPFNDEVYSYLDAKSLSGINIATRPFFYFVLAAWMHISESITWMRLPAAIFSILSVLLIYRTGLFFFRKPVALIAAIILLLSPDALRYAQIVRMYSLGNLITLAGSLALGKALQSRSVKYLNYWAFLRLLGILTIPLSVTLFVPDSLIILWNLRKERSFLIQAFWRGALALTLWLPSFYFLESEKSRFFSNWVNLCPRPTSLSAISFLFFHTSFGDIPRNISKNVFHLYWAVAIVVIALTFLPVILSSFRKQELSKDATSSVRPPDVWLLLWSIIPFVCLACYSLYGGNLWFPKYFFFIQPYMILLLACGFYEIQKFNRGVGFIIMAGYLYASGMNILHSEIPGAPSQYSYDLAQDLSQLEKPGDALMLIASEPSRQADVLRYFYRGHLTFYAPEELANSGDQWSLPPEKLNSSFSKIEKGNSRIWLVIRPSGLTREGISKLQDYLNDHFIVSERHHYYLLDLLLLKLPPKTAE